MMEEEVKIHPPGSLLLRSVLFPIRSCRADSTRVANLLWETDRKLKFTVSIAAAAAAVISFKIFLLFPCRRKEGGKAEGESVVWDGRPEQLSVCFSSSATQYNGASDVTGLAIEFAPFSLPLSLSFMAVAAQRPWGNFRVRYMQIGAIECIKTDTYFPSSLSLCVCVCVCAI